jgi:hypothetical protein
VSHRTQITLDDAQYQRLRQKSRQTGIGLAELIRRAVDHTYGEADTDSVAQALEDSFGTWSDLDLDGEQYVESLRQARADRLGEW